MNPITEKEGITDARKLGLPKYVILGVQHLFAIFGATDLILVIAIGVKYGADDNVNIGPIHFSGLALSAIVGVTLNAVLPGKLGLKMKSVHGKEKKEHEPS